MPTTPIYNFPYPADSDPPDGAQQIQDLAEDAETVIDGIDDRLDTVEAGFLAGTAGHAFFYSVAGQAIPGSSDTKLVFGASRHLCPEVTIGTGNTFTINKAGVWSVKTGMRPPNGASGDKLLWIGQGGSPTTQRSGFDSVTSGAGFQGMTMAVDKRYTVGQTVSVYTYTSSGYTLDPADDSPFVSFTWIRP
jgi:hypothetical protein